MHIHTGVYKFYKFYKNSRSHLKIPGVTRATRSDFLTEYPQILLEATVKIYSIGICAPLYIYIYTLYKVLIIKFFTDRSSM
jgi:hypothetical protein